MANSNYTRGEMEINDHKGTFSGFMGMSKYGGAAIIVLQWPLFAGAFRISPASPQVEAMARSYMGIRVWSAPALIALFAITGWLIAAERTAAVLVIQLWMNGLNIVLDLWFVLGLDWGVQGVAIATFLAEWSGAAIQRGDLEGPRSGDIAYSATGWRWCGDGAGHRGAQQGGGQG